MTLATWNGPFDAEVFTATGKRILRAGDECEVGDAELLSAHWVAATPEPARASKTETTKTDEKGDD